MTKAMLQDDLEAWWTINYEFLPLISAGELLMFPLEIIMGREYISVLDNIKAFTSLPCLTSLVLWKSSGCNKLLLDHFITVHLL